MSEILTTPLFGIFMTFLAYEIGVTLNKKIKHPLVNPILVGIIIIISFLVIFKIDYESYKIGGDYIHFFLGPATVILAVPLYKQRELLRKNFLPITVGIFLGSTAGMVSIIVMGKILKLEDPVIKGLMPKSVTAPIAIEVADQLTGMPSITIVGLFITGFIGAIFADRICLLFRIKDKVAAGVGIGTSTHALGTTKALQMGETEGALSGLSIGVAGIMTVLIAPVLAFIFGY